MSTTIRLRISSQARHSTSSQAAFYSQESGPTLANRWRVNVNNAIRSLKQLPERGAPCNFKRSSLTGLRWIPIEGFPRHMVYYRYVAEGNAVYVLDILHGVQDVESILL